MLDTAQDARQEVGPELDAKEDAGRCTGCRTLHRTPLERTLDAGQDTGPFGQGGEARLDAEADAGP